MTKAPFLIAMLSTLFSLFGCSNSPVRIVHYNIKELSTSKIQAKNLPQLLAIEEVFSTLPFKAKKIDILSLNEIQFDQNGIPTPQYQSKGRNLKKLAKKLNLTFSHQVFHPANTGEKAIPKEDGTYSEKWTQENIARADKVNFGLFPHQYSTGALIQYPPVSELIIKDLPWKTFNPHADLEQFRTANGKKLPEDTPLFDKNFTDITLKINGKRVHLILLHAVAAFHFGNSESPNDARNRDQLRFLEWYLTGETDINVSLPHIRPLQEEERYLAMGDWNANFHENKEGTRVHKRILLKTKSWISPEKIEKEQLFTNTTKDQNLMLDYIVTSPDIHIHRGGILTPLPEQKETFLQASDHLPIWAEIEL